MARGIAVLDERVPGWRDRVRVAALDLDSCWLCVLGQAFNEAWEREPHRWGRQATSAYEYGLRSLCPDAADAVHGPAATSWAEAHGFTADVPRDASGRAFEAVVDALTSAWRVALGGLPLGRRLRVGRYPAMCEHCSGVIHGAADGGDCTWRCEACGESGMCEACADDPKAHECEGPTHGDHD